MSHPSACSPSSWIPSAPIVPTLPILHECCPAQYHPFRSARVYVSGTAPILRWHAAPSFRAGSLLLKWTQQRAPVSFVPPELPGQLPHLFYSWKIISKKNWIFLLCPLPPSLFLFRLKIREP